MKDLAVELEDQPGALAELATALGRARVSIEGGGAFVIEGHAVAHFLFEDGAAARSALEAAGFVRVKESEVVTVSLRQDEPGQLGKLTALMAEAGVNIEVLYSDHDHRLVLVVDDLEAGRRVAYMWGEAPS